MAGGSLDVTAYEQHDDGTIEEIYKATGDSCNAAPMNRLFKHILGKVFGAQMLHDYRKLFPSDWLKMTQDFEPMKWPFQNEETKIRLPGSFVSSVNDFRTPSLKRYAAGDVKIIDDEFLCFSPKVMRNFFQFFIKAVRRHLKALLSKLQLSKTTTMFVVGGYADDVRKDFSDEYCVIAPANAINVVLKGALMVAKTTAVWKTTVVGATYGVDCSRHFIRRKYPEEKMFLVNGKPRCKDLFNSFVNKGDTVNHGQKISIRYRPREANETDIKFFFFLFFLFFCFVFFLRRTYS